MKKRLFIAINLPENIKQQLTDWLNGFIKLNQNQPIKWVRPEGLHLTLHFLGYLDEEKTSAVRVMLKQISSARISSHGRRHWPMSPSSAPTSQPTSRRSPLRGDSDGGEKTELTFYQLDAFPNLRQPQIIIIKGKENKMITDLQAAIGVELEKLNIEIDNRSWQAHLTLGRVHPVKYPAKGGVSRSIAGQFDGARGPGNLKTKDIQPFSFEVESIELMESHLSSAGADYEIVESFLLRT